MYNHLINVTDRVCSGKSGLSDGGQLKLINTTFNGLSVSLEETSITSSCETVQIRARQTVRDRNGKRERSTAMS